MENTCAKCILSNGDHPHIIQMDQAFPLHFCILRAIKNWTVGRPGNEASVHVLWQLAPSGDKELINPWAPSGGQGVNKSMGSLRGQGVNKSMGSLRGQGVNIPVALVYITAIVSWRC